MIPVESDYGRGQGSEKLERCSFLRVPREAGRRGADLDLDLVVANVAGLKAVPCSDGAKDLGLNLVVLEEARSER